MPPRPSRCQFKASVLQPYVPRPRLTKKNLDALAAKMRRIYGWRSDPKPFQLEAIKAQLEGVDVIVQAPTGAGKTAIAAGPHLWPGSEKKFTIMVCPLLSLEEEMVRFSLTYSQHGHSLCFAMNRRRLLRRISS